MRYIHITATINIEGRSLLLITEFMGQICSLQDTSAINKYYHHVVFYDLILQGKEKSCLRCFNVPLHAPILLFVICSTSKHGPCRKSEANSILISKHALP